ncbi:MAG TPA: hypothetical protein VIH75_19815 [Candidatus Sulfotelmatobacter sp.]
MHGLSVLIHFALFKDHGFFADSTLWTPLALGFGYNVGHLIPPIPNVSRASDSSLSNVAHPTKKFAQHLTLYPGGEEIANTVGARSMARHPDARDAEMLSEENLNELRHNLAQ